MGRGKGPQEVGTTEEAREESRDKGDATCTLTVPLASLGSAVFVRAVSSHRSLFIHR